MTRKRFLQALTLTLALVLLLTNSAQAMTIHQAISTTNPYRNQSMISSALSDNVEKLSRGARINFAGADVAGMAIAELMRAQTKGLRAYSGDPASKDGDILEAYQQTQSIMGNMAKLILQTDDSAWLQQPDNGDAVPEPDSLCTEHPDAPHGTAECGTHYACAQGEHQSLPDCGHYLCDHAADFDCTQAPYSAFSGTLDESTMISGYVSGSNALALITTNNGSSYGYVQLATNGAVIYGSDNPMAILVSANGDIATLSEGAAAIGMFDPSGSFIAAWSLYTNGESLYAVQDSALQITQEGRAISSLTLSVGQSIQLNVQEADSTPESTNGSDELRINLPGLGNGAGTNNQQSAPDDAMYAQSQGIRDTDIAEEMMTYTKNNILLQSAQAMLAQANAVPHGVLMMLQ